LRKLDGTAETNGFASAPIRSDGLKFIGETPTTLNTACQ
jgi:hypothetical protein